MSKFVGYSLSSLFEFYVFIRPNLEITVWENSSSYVESVGL